MKRLGELLLERGAITMEALQTCLEECHRSGGRLGTHLLRLAFVDEQALLDSLSAQYSVPSVPRKLLLRAAPLISHVLPAEVARRLQVLPFEESRGRLHVAMINPRDPAALEEISGFVDLAIDPYVATETAIRDALADLGGDVGGMELAMEPVQRAADTTGPAWESLWEPPGVTPEAHLRVQVPRSRVPPPVIHATFPGLSPLLDVSAGDVEPVLDHASFIDQLREVRHRDDVGRLLIRYAARLLPRVCLFAVHKDRVVGWMARGQSVVVDDVQSVEIPLDAPSPFLKLMKGGTHLMASLPGSDADGVLVKAMGDPPPTEVVVVPVRLKERAVAFLVGDDPGEESVNVPVQELADAVQKAGIAFEILIMKKKIEA